MLQTVRIALAASAPGDVLVTTLAAEIDAIRVDRRSYGYRESSTLAQELDRIREGIAAELLPIHPRAAAELLGKLIRLDANVFERSDDSDGVIGDAGEHIGEPSLWIDIIKLGRHDQRCHDRDAVGTSVGAGEQPGFTPQRKSAQRTFSGIVAEADPAGPGKRDGSVCRVCRADFSNRC